jgi:hypothetical protein
MALTKYCPDCGEERPIDVFTRDKRRRDGLAFYCRDHARAAEGLEGVASRASVATSPGRA